MAIGRTFKEALQKGLRSLEQGRFGLGADGKDKMNVRDLNIEEREEAIKQVKSKLLTPKPDNIFYVRYALQLGVSIEELNKITKIDKWFLMNIKQIVDFENELYNYSIT